MSRMLSYFGEKEARILVLGLDNAGKTTILCECDLPPAGTTAAAAAGGFDGALFLLPPRLPPLPLLVRSLLVAQRATPHSPAPGSLAVARDGGGPLHAPAVRSHGGARSVPPLPAALCLCPALGPCPTPSRPALLHTNPLDDRPAAGRGGGVDNPHDWVQC
jgi:hypothetical protein